MIGTCESKTLDSLRIEPYRSALLWANIMGSTYEALIGAKSSLENISMLVLNVNFQTQYKSRKVDFFKVDSFLTKTGYVPIYIELRNKNFGWIAYTKPKQILFRSVIKSYFLRMFALTLHLLYSFLPRN